MKKIITIALLLAIACFAYTRFYLVECNYKCEGNQCGYYGLYKSDGGDYYKFFCGNKWCEYNIEMK